jgi:hypothetical protein
MIDGEYPAGFKWEICPDCRVQWLRDESMFSMGRGPHVERDTLEAGTQIKVRIGHGYT